MKTISEIIGGAQGVCVSGVKILFDPAEKEAYKTRSSVERANSHFKDLFLPKRFTPESMRRCFFS